jgi:hypothetical protein
MAHSTRWPSSLRRGPHRYEPPSPPRSLHAQSLASQHASLKLNTVLVEAIKEFSQPLPPTITQRKMLAIQRLIEKHRQVQQAVTQRCEASEKRLDAALEAFSARANDVDEHVVGAIEQSTSELEQFTRQLSNMGPLLDGGQPEKSTPASLSASALPTASPLPSLSPKGT